MARISRRKRNRVIRKHCPELFVRPEPVPENLMEVLTPSLQAAAETATVTINARDARVVIYGATSGP